MAAASRQEPPPSPLLSVSTARLSVPRCRPRSPLRGQDQNGRTGWTDTQSPPQPRRRSTESRQRVEAALQTFWRQRQPRTVAGGDPPEKRVLGPMPQS